MTPEEVRARYLISEAAWAAMRIATLEVHDITGEVAALVVRATPDVEEDDDAFFYDVDWLQWMKIAYPGRNIIGGMVPLDDDEDEAGYIWFVALD